MTSVRWESTSVKLQCCNTSGCCREEFLLLKNSFWAQPLWFSQCEILKNSSFPMPKLQLLLKSLILHHVSCCDTELYVDYTQGLLLFFFNFLITFTCFWLKFIFFFQMLIVKPWKSKFRVLYSWDYSSGSMPLVSACLGTEFRHPAPSHFNHFVTSKPNSYAECFWKFSKVKS